MILLAPPVNESAQKVSYYQEIVPNLILLLFNKLKKLQRGLICGANGFHVL